MRLARFAGPLLTVWLPLCIACGGDADSAADGGGGEEGASTTGPAGEADELDVELPPADTVDAAVEAAPEAAPGPVVADSLAEDARETADSVAMPVPDVLIPAGTRISVISDEDISTADHSVDDPVVATVWEDVADIDGTILIPAGTKVLGRVLASLGSGGAGEDPVLEIAFETLSAWTWERPVEGTVAEALVVLDPAGDFERRRSEGRRAAVTMVPAKIMAGSLIVVELRAPVLVPPAFVLPDSVMPGDTVPQAVDTAAPRDLGGSGDSADSGDPAALSRSGFAISKIATGSYVFLLRVADGETAPPGVRPAR